ncbi:MAG: class I SAM-dependent methyltransferase [Planctomycetota bacterium]
MPPGGEARPDAPDPFAAWVSDLETRHLSPLGVPAVRRGIQALSTIYVERRTSLARGAALDGDGKRAAFALFYAPLHFLAARFAARALGAANPPPSRILDLGCGTLAAGAAWAIEAAGRPALVGVERQAWAVEEARRTVRALGLSGYARRGDALRTPLPGAGGAIVAGWLANEIGEDGRARLLPRLLDAAARGARILVLEPIAERLSPWWDGWAEAVLAAGGRADLWRFEADLPEPIRRLDEAAGLDHSEITARTLWLPGAHPLAPYAPAGVSSLTSGEILRHQKTFPR